MQNGVHAAGARLPFYHSTTHAFASIWRTEVSFKLSIFIDRFWSINFCWPYWSIDIYM